MTKRAHVVDLADLGSETLSLAGVFAPGEIDFSGDDLEQTGALAWTASIQGQSGGARFAGELRTNVRLRCVRCVSPIDRPLEGTFVLFFERRERELFRDRDEVELDPSDTATAFLAGTELAVDQVMREQVVLSLPMKPLCDSACRGLCAGCGANLNLGPCACPTRPDNPAFEPLLELKKRLERGTAD